MASAGANAADAPLNEQQVAVMTTASHFNELDLARPTGGLFGPAGARVRVRPVNRGSDDAASDETLHHIALRPLLHRVGRTAFTA